MLRKLESPTVGLGAPLLPWFSPRSNHHHSLLPEYQSGSPLLGVEATAAPPVINEE